MKFAIFSAGVISALALVGCNAFNFNHIAGNGQIISTNYDLTGFQCVDAGATFEVNIHPGERFAVSITTDSNLLDDLSVTRDGSWLRLGVKSGVGIAPTKLVADVTMPSLTGVSASGATHLDFDSFTTDEFKAEASGASHINGEIHAKRGYIECSGASEVKFLGQISSMNLKVSGASHVNCSAVKADKGTVDLSGASHADVNASEQLDYDLSGASHLDYSGDARVGHSDCSGASGVSHKEASL
jgi:hypothetical protein